MRESKVNLTVALKFVAFTALTFVICQLGFSFASGNPFASALATPIGVAVALLLISGWAAAAPVFFGTFASHVIAMKSSPGSSAASVMFGAAVISFIIALQSMASCWAAQKLCGGQRAFERPRTIFYFLAAAGIGVSGIAAAARAICASSFQPGEPGQFWFLMWNWWLGSLCGVSVGTPVILAWRNFRLPSISVSRLAEYGILILLLLFCCNVLFGGLFPQQISACLAFLLLPLLLWSALRFSPRGTSLAVLLVVLIAVDATVHGAGPFASANRQTSLALLQAFIVIVSSLAFVVEADVFDRRSAVAALQASEGRYRYLFEQNPEPMWVYDDETLRFLAVNKSAVAQYGYSESEFLKLSVPDVRLSEKSPISKTIENLPGGTTDVQCTHRRKDGSTLEVETVRHSLTIDGRQAWLVLSTDVTERRRAERHSETFALLGRKLSAARTPREAAAIMFEAADALFKWDASIFELLVPAEDTAINILCMDIVDGKRKEVVPEPRVRSVSAAGMEAMQGAKLILRETASGFTRRTIPFGDKTRASASLMFVPVKNGDRVIGSLSLQSYNPNAFTQRDLQTLESLADHCAGALDRIRAESESERLAAELRENLETLRSFNEKLEARVQERTAQLQTINKELEAFSYSVSHDLRAPLRSIRGFTEVLLERHSAQLDDRGREFLQRVCASSQQMDRLIEDLLKLSRVGRAEILMQDVDLSIMAENILGELKKTDAQRDVEFAVAPGLRVKGDERLLRVVMDNLLQNAWKFTAKTPNAKIEVGKNGHDSIFVKDNGAGFDDKYGSRLFGVFQRLHTASEFPGTGVGLATAQRIINRHGGKIWGEGSINKGATFYFTLPQHEPC